MTKPTPMNGLFIGRFQPFHNGHLMIIENALKKVDTLNIVIGSTQHSRTEKNPLTAEERETLIKTTLAKKNITRYKIYHIPDINDDEGYVKHVIAHTGPVDLVFTGDNQLNKDLFLRAGYPVRSCERMNGWIATEIRKRIRNDQPYEDLTPYPLPEKIEQIIRSLPT